MDKLKTTLSTAIRPTFEEKQVVNFGPLTTEFKRQMFTYPK